MPAESVNTLWSSLALGTEIRFETSWAVVFEWFQQVDCFPKLIWKGRECSTVYFCVGIGRPQTEFPTFTVQAFDRTQPQWDGFPSTLKWTPFGVIELCSEDLTIGKMYKSTQQEQWKPSKGNIQKHRENKPSFEQWVDNVEQSKQLFHETSLRKIVLARETFFEPPNPWQQFVKLKNSQPNNYLFLFSPQPNAIFLGASPEKLFSQTGSILKTEALAGTRSVSKNQIENESLKQELNQSTKDQTEHHIVVHYLHTQLKDLCLEQRSLNQEILQLPDVQHLRTPIECKLHPNTTTDQLLERLHPTPAVCGIPKRISNQLIAKLEPFNRGWYAGTMGIEHNTNSDFTVMIRSALWRGDTGYAWSGAGIVPESDARLEWKEVENKAKQFTKNGSR